MSNKNKFNTKYGNPIQNIPEPDTTLGELFKAAELTPRAANTTKEDLMNLITRTPTESTSDLSMSDLYSINSVLSGEIVHGFNSEVGLVGEAGGETDGLSCCSCTIACCCSCSAASSVNSSAASQSPTI
jgi:hypothetical protein